MAGSLGTLTLDLIAKIGGYTGPLDKASQETKKRNAEIAKSFDSLAKGIGTAIGSIPAVLTALVVSSSNSAKEIANLSALAGLGTTEFQKLAAGARSVGVDQDKLADIFKDTNDKLGDFINTGGGALKDFFTNIAPMVGVTADQFKKLNSKDALALYVTSLEKANVSQAEMTFYMEAIASDSTALVPLLRDNAKGFDELGASAEDAGIVMSEGTIAAAKQFGLELQGLGQYVKSAQVALAAEFLPVLLQFSKDVNQSAKDSGGLSKVVKGLGEDLVSTTAFIVNAGDGVARVFDIVANVIVGTFATASARISNLSSQANTALGALTFGETSKEFKANAASFASDAQIQFGVAAQAAAKITEDLEKPLAGDRFKEYVANAKKAASEIAITNQAITKGTGSGVDPAAIAANAAAQKKAASDAAAAAKKIQDTFNTTETDYKRQIDLINTSTDARKNATEVAKLQFEIESGKLVGINAAQQERLKGLAAELDVQLKLKKANEDAAKLAAFSDSLRDSNRTAKEGFQIELAGGGSGDELKDRLKADLAIRQDFDKQQADLQKQYNGGDISQEMYDSETEMLQEALAERLVLQQDYYNQIDDAQSNWLDGVSSAWENYKDTATDYQQQAKDATTSILGDTTSSIASNLEGIRQGTVDAGEAAKNVMSDLALSVITALERMAAQWIIYQGIQLLTGKATQASASVAMVANAQATAFQASLAAFASTAAIPIVGPIAAPAAAAAAASFAAPLVAGVATASLAGMAHDGLDAVPETGTWLLQKGERVTTAETSAKLDKTLNDVQSANGSRGGTVVNLFEDASKAGQSRTRTENGQDVVELWVANIMNDGAAHQAMEQKYGLGTVGS
jgi:lambda family phage tail tape measure protein